MHTYKHIIILYLVNKHRQFIVKEKTLLIVRQYTKIFFKKNVNNYASVQT
jgi:hypothetical protein